jgi:peptidoglycan lytic transglycosylase
MNVYPPLKMLNPLVSSWLLGISIMLSVSSLCEASASSAAATAVPTAAVSTTAVPTTAVSTTEIPITAIPTAATPTTTIPTAAIPTTQINVTKLRTDYQESASPPPDDKYVDQRKQYKQTFAAIKKGHRTNSQRGLKQLRDYPLYSYLLKEQLGRKLKQLPYTEVDQFLTSHGDTVVGMQLRKRWLAVLAQKKLWAKFMQYYHPDIASTTLRCSYLEALHQNGFTKIAHNKTSEIWLSGKSLPDQCNSAFKRWQTAGGKTDELVWSRVKLALNANNTRLARYLSERASAPLKPYTRRLINVHRKPRRLEKKADFKDNTDYTVDIITHGLQRLVSKDANLTSRLWVSYRGYTAFSDQQYHAIRNKLARQLIASSDPSALQWLIVHDPNVEDSYLLEWRIRLALKKQQWARAGHWISLLPYELQKEPRWRYWLARVYQKTGQPAEKSNKLMSELAKERHYYGFLAADARSDHYGFNHSERTILVDDFQISQIPALARAHEFYKLGELINARREWRSGTQSLDLAQLSNATSLAHSWGWHQQAIHTTIKAQQWNNLSIRFPLAYQSHMVDAAKSTTISLEWLYAIARQESAFADDAYSSAGARGLLQLRPSTAKKIAHRIGVKYKTRDLYQADKNITLGSVYLKELLEVFEGNRILATAAYNAGPHRVKKWLKKQDKALPYDIWIETLPFYETRNYVQNVLAFSVIYGYRLGTDSPLIGAQETVIEQPEPNRRAQ